MFALVDIVVYIQLMPQIGDASCLRKTPDILSIHMDECHSYQVIVNVCVCVCYVGGRIYWESIHMDS